MAKDEKEIKQEEDVELTPEQIEENSKRVAEQLEKEKQEKKAAREKEMQSKEGMKMYSEDQVREIVRQMMAESKAKALEEDDDEELFKKKKVRIPRFQNKFIVGFKNTNTDPYFPELVVQAFNVWNDQIKREEAWVTCLFDDGSELNIQLYTILTKSIKVQCDLIDVKAKDVSFSNGKTEVMGEVKDYSRAGTGVYTKLKVNMNEYSFLVKLGDVETLVGPEVINW